MTNETALARGRYIFSFFDLKGALSQRIIIDNVVCTLGKNIALDAYLSGNPYNVVGPYLGLISGTDFVAVNAGDSMISHPGWIEAGDANEPTYSGARSTIAWAPAFNGSKTMSSLAQFNFISSGIVQGAFLTFGPGALSTIDSITGVLYSAGTFSAGVEVGLGKVLQVSYTASM